MIYPFLIPWMKEKLMSLDFTFTLLTWLEARNKHIGKTAEDASVDLGHCGEGKMGKFSFWQILKSVYDQKKI